MKSCLDSARLILLAGVAFLLSAPLAAASEEQTPQDEATKLNEKWTQFLNSEGVFGDYSETSFQLVSSLENTRQLVYATVREGEVSGASDPARRLALRALWAGSNLERQAMLATTDREKRQDYAWRTIAMIRKIRVILDNQSLQSLESDPAARSYWAQALLQMDVMEEEGSREVPFSTSSVRQRVRDAIDREFTPSNSDQFGPNALVMKEVGERFEACRKLAKKAAAATTQASLALGKVYGYPPDYQRNRIEAILPPEEVVGEEGRKGLYPSTHKGPEEDQSPWARVTELVMRTSGGGYSTGIIGDYADARQALGIKKEIALLNMIPNKDYLKYGEPPLMHVPYELDRLAKGINDVQQKLMTRVPEMPEKGKFGPFGINGKGEVSEGGLPDYWKWFMGSTKFSRTQAWEELQQLGGEIKALELPKGPSDSVPLDDATIGDLAVVAEIVLGRTKPKAIEDVRGWLKDWIREEATRVSPRAFEQTPPQSKDKTPQSNNSREIENEPRGQRSGITAANVRGVRSVETGQSLDKTVWRTLFAVSHKPRSGEILELTSATNPEESPQKEPQTKAPVKGETTVTITDLSDESFLTLCLASLKRGESWTSQARQPPPEAGVAKQLAERATEIQARLEKLRAGTGELRKIAAAIRDEEERLQTPQELDSTIADKIRLGSKDRIQKLLEAGGGDSIVGQGVLIEKHDKQVDLDSRAIAALFARWGSLQDWLRAQTSKARSILADNSTAGEAKSKIVIRIEALKKGVESPPLFQLKTEELQKLEQYYFPTQPDKPVQVRPIPEVETDNPALNIRLVRQSLAGYELCAANLPKKLRELDPRIDELKRRLRDFNYPVPPGRDDYGKVLKAFKEISEKGKKP